MINAAERVRLEHTTVLQVSRQDVAAGDDDEMAVWLAGETFGVLRRTFSNPNTSVATRLRLVRVVIRSRHLFGSESWVLMATAARRVSSMHMRWLRHTLRMHHTIMDGHIKFPTNEDTLGQGQEDLIVDQIRHARLRAYGHIVRHEPEAAFFIKGCLPSHLQSTGTVATWREQVLSDMRQCGLEEGDVTDRDRWRSGIARFVTRAAKRKYGPR